MVPPVEMFIGLLVTGCVATLSPVLGGPAGADAAQKMADIFLRQTNGPRPKIHSWHRCTMRLRAERGPSPQELVKQASLAARLQDLDIIRLEAGIERREPAQWDELRVWDPGDG